MLRPGRVVVRAARHELHPVWRSEQRATFLFFPDNLQSNSPIDAVARGIPSAEHLQAVVDSSCCIFPVSSRTAHSGRLWICLRRERSNDFLETRIAAQRVPIRMKL